MRSGLVRIVVQHEAGNDFGFADRRVGLLEDSFVEREKAQAGITPPVVVIGPVDGAGQSDHLGDSLVVRVSTVSSLRPHPSMKRWDAYDSDIACELFGAADATESSILQESKKFDLHGWRHGVEFI